MRKLRVKVKGFSFIRRDGKTIRVKGYMRGNPTRTCKGLYGEVTQPRGEISGKK